VAVAFMLLFREDGKTSKEQTESERRT